MILEEMIQSQYPTLYARIHNINSNIFSISLSWFMNLFIDCMPMISVARIWDVLFLEGDKCLLRFALALIDLKKPELEQLEDDMELVNRYK